MEYQKCLEACVSIALADGKNAYVAIYRSFPTPSEKEWAECLREVADYPLDDLENPYHCMGRYEMRLHKREIRTPLSIAVDEFKAIAIEVGLPLEHLPDAIMLSEIMKTARRTDDGRNQ